MINHEDDDTEVPGTRPAITRPQTRHAIQPQVDAAGETHPGNVRANNEDHFLVTRFGRFIEKVATNLPSSDIPPRTEEAGYCLLVADGMGGHAAGETASRMAIETLIELALETPDWILRLDDPASSKEVIRRTRERFALINTTLTRHGQTDPALRGLGTTLTLALTLGPDLFIFHVGDSRAYLHRAGSLRQLTRDHTFAQTLADRGTIAPEEVATHRMKHVLTRAIGVEGKEVQPDVIHMTLEDGDKLLLCSDGLTDMVPDDQIADVLASEPDAGAASRLLVAKALAAGGADNVTVVVAAWRFPASGEQPGP